MSVSPTIIHTPLGSLSVRVTGLDAADYRIEWTRPAIQLPGGQSVDGVVAAIIWLAPARPVSAVRCACEWEHAPGAGDPESGEGLDAQSWDHGLHRVSIGTEDGEALRARLPGLGFTDARYPVRYAPQGMIIDLPALAPGRDFSLHFVVAWRAITDPLDCSTWFAVDIPHASLLSSSKLTPRSVSTDLSRHK